MFYLRLLQVMNDVQMQNQLHGMLHQQQQQQQQHRNNMDRPYNQQMR